MEARWKQLATKALGLSGAGLFTAAGLSLVLIKVFDPLPENPKWLFARDGTNGSGAAHSPNAPKAPKTPKASGAEIRKYTEFVTVDYDALNLRITTGIRYKDSTNRKIEAQWCYAAPMGANNRGLVYRLWLANWDGGKLKNHAPFPVQSLRKFNLTSEQASGLIGYCRFKTA